MLAKHDSFDENPVRSVSANLSRRWSKLVRTDKITETVPSSLPDLEGLYDQRCNS